MVVIAAVVVLVGSGVFFGWYQPVYRPLHETVLRVGNTNFTMGYLIDSYKYQFGEATQGQWWYTWYYMDYALDVIKNGELMRQEAEGLGITVSEAEIDQYLKGHPEAKNRALRDITRTQLLYGKLSDEYFAPQLPENPLQREIFAMLLESQTQVYEIQDRLADGEDFGALAEEYSLNEYTKNKAGEIGFRPRDVIQSLLGVDGAEDIIFAQSVGTTSYIWDENATKNVGYWLIMVTQRDEDEEDLARISAMKLGSMEEALMVKAKLDDGEDFDALAEQYSRIWDSEKESADIGWVRASDDKAYIEYVFSEETEIGSVSAPIQDTSSDGAVPGGYWLFYVRAEENRPLSGEDRARMIGQLYEEWMQEAEENAEDIIVNNFDEERLNWAYNYLTGTRS